MLSAKPLRATDAGKAKKLVLLSDALKRSSRTRAHHRESPRGERRQTFEQARSAGLY
jgi:hypothetical protein